MVKGKSRRPVEVLQISSIDCGPAVVTSLAQSFGQSIEYEHVRELCRTEADGTTIDALQEVLERLGFEAEESLVPSEHLLDPKAGYVPAVVVQKGGGAGNHFLILWDAEDKRVKLMDPARGITSREIRSFERQLLNYSMAVPAGGWSEFARTDEFIAPLRRRLNRYLDSRSVTESIDAALRDESYRSFAALDAAARMFREFIEAGIINRRATRELWSRIAPEGILRDGAIPKEYFSVEPIAGDSESVQLSGAVVLSVKPPDIAARVEPTTQSSSTTDRTSVLTPKKALPPMLQVWRDYRKIMGPTQLALAALSCLGVGLAIFAESLIFNGLLVVPAQLPRLEDRRLFVGGAILFFTLSLGLRHGLLAISRSTGRSLEYDFRVRLYEAFDRLQPRFFESRNEADVAQRFHTMETLSQIPFQGYGMIRESCSILFHLVAITLFDTAAGIIAVSAALISLLTTLLYWRHSQELNLRLQNFVGALSVHYQEALRGRAPLRAHAAERVIISEHEKKLSTWRRHAENQIVLRTASTASESAVSTVGLAILVFALYEDRALALILLCYWFVAMMGSTAELSRSILFSFVSQRNAIQRLYEPIRAALNAPKHKLARTESRQRELTLSGPASLRFENVVAIEGGHRVLEVLDLKIPARAHVAVVGPSGAGKSTLAGLILGTHQVREGQILLNDQVMATDTHQRLLEQTAWIDPGVYLWNESLLDNVSSAQGGGGTPYSTEELIEFASLHDVLANLAKGAASAIGEEGRLLSGGEGQRVRMARAIGTNSPVLAILDEAFRGLDKDLRARCLERLREIWRDVTMLVITHDIEEALLFDLVVVVDSGQVVEAGSPLSLDEEGHKFHEMLAEHRRVQKEVWRDSSWRRTRVKDGHLVREIH